jgi:hypothetical protein
MAFGVIGREQIVMGAGVETLTVPAAATHAWIQADVQNVRYELDGTDPTATTGLTMFDGDRPIELNNENGLQTAEFIREAVGALLNAIYFGNV